MGLFIPGPAFAYAGPGVALGALIVFISVCALTVFSLTLKSYSLIKKHFLRLASFCKFRKKNISANKTNNS